MTAPAAPVITAPTDGATVSSPVSVVGTAGADGTVTVYDGDASVASATAALDSWSVTLTLDAGPHKLWATVADANGNSEASGDVNVTVEVPPVPDGDASGAGEGSAQPDPAPDAPSTGTQTVSEPGQPPSETPAPDPSTLTATVDPNPSSTGNADATPPAETAPAPTDPSVDGTPDAPIIEVPAASAELDESLVQVSGTAEAYGATVIVSADARAIGQASVDSTGNWSLEASLPNGEYDLTAVVNDTGKVSAVSDTVAITVNYDASTPAPAEPTDPDEALAQFLRTRVLRGYPLNWELISELRARVARWLDAKKL